MKNIPQYLMYVLLALGAVFCLMSVLGDNHDPLLQYMKLLTIASAVLAVASLILGMVVKPETLMTTLVIVVGLAVTFGIGYGLASDEVLSTYPEGITPSVSKMSGAGLYMLYILGIMAVGSIVFTSVFNMVKK